MLVSKTTNRKVYIITDITNNSNHIRIHLNDYVNYSNGDYDHIDVANRYYSYNYNYGYYNNQYRIDKYVEIDNSKTRYENSGHEFSDDGSVIKITDISAAIIHRAREEFSGLQRQKSALEVKNAELEKTIEKGLGMLAVRDSKIEEKTNEINRLDAQIKEGREEYKAEKEKREELKNENVSLQIESSNKSQEIKEQKGKVKELEEKLIVSEEKSLNRELEAKEEKLETFAKSLDVNRKKVRELRKLYRQLIRTREDNYNQGELDEIDGKIEDTKDELLEKGISMVDVQKLLRKCKEFTQLKIEHEKLLREQYQAKTEVPPRY